MEHCLVGKIIKDMKIASDQLALLFILSDDSEIIARVDGDCCSQSWIEHVQLPALGFPAYVTDIDDLDIDRFFADIDGNLNKEAAQIENNEYREDNEYGEYDDEEEYQDEDICFDENVVVRYGLVIHTTKGDIFIEYRNSSNGYYGGNLCWPDDSFYGGVHEQNVSNNDWVSISEV